MIVEDTFTETNPRAQPIAIKYTNKRAQNKYNSRSFDEGRFSRPRTKIGHQNRNVTSFPNYPKNDDSNPSSSEDSNHLEKRPLIFSPNHPKGAGVIPYAVVDNNSYFLLQHADVPCRRKDRGWNDFGGKKNGDEESTSTATREFNEETSCLFYLKESNTVENVELYEKLKNNVLLEYDDDTISKLINIIPIAQKHFANKIDESTLSISSRDTYICYFVKVNYIPAKDLPTAEDLHISYTERYTRICKWFTFDELMNFETTDFHKRLQITKIKSHIKIYHEKKLFI